MRLTLLSKVANNTLFREMPFLHAKNKFLQVYSILKFKCIYYLKPRIIIPFAFCKIIPYKLPFMDNYSAQFYICLLIKDFYYSGFYDYLVENLNKELTFQLLQIKDFNTKHIFDLNSSVFCSKVNPIYSDFIFVQLIRYHEDFLLNNYYKLEICYKNKRYPFNLSYKLVKTFNLDYTKMLVNYKDCDYYPNDFSLRNKFVLRTRTFIQNCQTISYSDFSTIYCRLELKRLMEGEAIVVNSEYSKNNNYSVDGFLTTVTANYFPLAKVSPYDIYNRKDLFNFNYPFF